MADYPENIDRRRSPSSSAAFGAAAGLYLAVQAIAFGSGLVDWYQHGGFDRPVFTAWMAHGVFRTRLLGTGLDLAVASAVHTSGMAGPIVAVNGVAFVAVAVLLYREWAGSLVGWFTVVVALAVSGYVVTPYDYLSYLSIAAVLLIALEQRGAVLVSAVMVVGVATRESVLLAIPALMVLESRVGRAVWVKAAVAGGATYVALHLTAGSSAMERVPLRENLHPWGFIGLAVTLALILAVRVGTGYRRSGLLWLLCLPYLAVVVVGGEWFETPRLIVPILLCDVLVAKAQIPQTVVRHADGRCEPRLGRARD